MEPTINDLVEYLESNGKEDLAELAWQMWRAVNWGSLSEYSTLRVEPGDYVRVTESPDVLAEMGIDPAFSGGIYPVVAVFSEGVQVGYGDTDGTSRREYFDFDEVQLANPADA